MKFSNEKVGKFVEALDAAPVQKLNPSGLDPNQRRRMPVMKGDRFHFVIDPSKDLLKEYVRNADTFRMVKDKDGKEISQNQLTRLGNGLDLEGDTSNEALGSFFEKVIANGKNGLVIEISDLKVNPSTIPGKPGAKIIYFSVVA